MTMDYIGTAIAVVGIFVLVGLAWIVFVFALFGLRWVLAPFIHFSSDQRARHRTIDEASAQVNKTNKRS